MQFSCLISNFYSSHMQKWSLVAFSLEFSQTLSSSFIFVLCLDFMFTECLDYLSLVLIILLFLCCSLTFSLSIYVVFSWENCFQLFPMVLNKNSNYTFGTSINWSTKTLGLEGQPVFQKDVGLFFLLPSSLFQHLSTASHGSHRCSKVISVSIGSPMIWFKMSFCKVSCLMIFRRQYQQFFYPGYISSHLVSDLYKSCMQLLIFFQACFLTFSMRWIFSLFLALLGYVQCLSPLLHLPISFKMSSGVLIMNFSYLLYTFFHVKFLVLSVPHIHCIQFNNYFLPYVWHVNLFLAALLELSSMWAYFLYYIAILFRNVSSGFR